MEYGSSLSVISKALGENISNKFESDKVDNFNNKIVHFNRILRSISHKYKQHLFELSINNIYLSQKTDNKKFNNYFDENEVIIQTLSKLIENYEDFPVTKKDFSGISEEDRLKIRNEIMRAEWEKSKKQ